MKTEYWEFLEKYNINDIKHEIDEKRANRKLEEILTENYKQIKSNIVNLPHKIDKCISFRSKFLRYRRIALVIFTLFLIVVATVIYLFRNWPGVYLTYYRINLIALFAVLVLLLFPTLVVYVNKVRKELIKYLKYIIINGEEELDLPIPYYLKKIFVPFGKGKETAVLGKIRCTCGNEGNMRFVVNTTRMNEGIPVSNFKEVTYIKAECLDCRSEHILFDSNIHGWNGHVKRRMGKEHDSFSFVECPMCKCLNHSAYINLFSPGKELFIRESFLMKEDGSYLREGEWVNAFSHINVIAQCNNCSKRFMIVDKSTM